MTVNFYGIPMVGFNEEELSVYVDSCLEDHRRITLGLSICFICMSGTMNLCVI